MRIFFRNPFDTASTRITLYHLHIADEHKTRLGKMHLTENFGNEVKESKSDLISLLSVSENHSFLQKPQEDEI